MQLCWSCADVLRQPTCRIVPAEFTLEALMRDATRRDAGLLSGYPGAIKTPIARLSAHRRNRGYCHPLKIWP